MILSCGGAKQYVSGHLLGFYMIVPKERMDLFSEMEANEKRNADYFIPLLTHEDYVIRKRSLTYSKGPKR